MQLNKHRKTQQTAPQMEKTIAAFEARRKFGQLIEEAYYRRDSFIVERSGRPMVALIPIDDYLRWKRYAKDKLFEIIDQNYEKNKNTPNEVLEQDVSLALNMLRKENLVAKE